MTNHVNICMLSTIVYQNLDSDKLEKVEIYFHLKNQTMKCSIMEKLNKYDFGNQNNPINEYN